MLLFFDVMLFVSLFAFDYPLTNIWLKSSWPLEVYDHNGRAHNVSMLPGESVKRKILTDDGKNCI
jgi:hypothetical protein